MDVGDTFDVGPADAATPQPNRRSTVIAGLLVGAVALAGGLLVVGRGPDDERVRPPETSTPPESTSDLDDPATVLELMPAGPLDGKESWRLPVLVVPQSGVVEGQSVTVLGRGFVPRERVGVVMCASEAAVEGVAACSLGTSTSSYVYVTYATARPDGDVVSPMRVRRFIETPATGPIDCASGPERCLVAIGAVDDYDRSGGSFVDFEGAPPFIQPAMLPEPAGPYAAGQTVTVRAVGLIPTRAVELLQCLGDGCLLLTRGEVAADGTFNGTGAVTPVLADAAGNPLPCGASCELRVQGVGLRGASSAPMPAPIPITFSDGAVAAPVSIDTTVPVEPATTPSAPSIAPEPPPTEPSPVPAPVASPPTVTDPPPGEPQPTDPQSSEPRTTATEPPASPSTTETIPPASYTTVLTTTPPEQVDLLASLVEASELVVAGTVSNVRPPDAPPDAPDTIEPPAVPVALVDIEPTRSLVGAAAEPIVLAWEGPSPPPSVGDELLLFLESEDPASRALFGSTYATISVLTLTDGVVTGGHEGSPALDALRDLTLDEVELRLAE